MSKFAFKFISGKYQGGEFPIPQAGELTIGRAADLDMVLVEEMVSRKHARLVIQQDTMVLEDLGSTNGTFINGEKITRAELKKDDRVLIGTNILKVVPANEQSEVTSKDALRSMMTTLGNRSDHGATSMSGDLAEVPLPDLLQLYATNKKTGTLTISSAQRARFFLRDGMLLNVVLQNEPTVPAMKALCRVLTWHQGSFQFDAVLQPPDMPGIWQVGTENLLIEALRQSDESQRLITQLPDLDKGARLVVPIRGRLADLSASELDILQWAINSPHMRLILERAPYTEHEVLTNLQKLIKGGFLQTP